MDVIKNHTKYILCTRSKSQHRKAIEVCHRCQDRVRCENYQKVQQPDRKLHQPSELVHALDALILHFDKNNISLEDLEYFRKELEKLAVLFRQ